MLAISLLGGLAALPVSSRQAVNYQVTEFRIPLGVKISEFLLRDYWYRRLADEITREAETPEARLERLLCWTRQHIRRTPAGWPVVDDHILHTILRGYGEAEQMADVFTCLSSYSGIPAFWGVVKPGRGTKERLILSFAWINGRWTAWDVAREITFRKEDGSLASVSELANDTRLISFNVGEIRHQGRPYAEYLLKGLPHFFAPEFRRPQKQMPFPRTLFEFKRLWRSDDADKFDPQIVFWD